MQLGTVVTVKTNNNYKHQQQQRATIPIEKNTTDNQNISQNVQKSITGDTASQGLSLQLQQAGLATGPNEQLESVLKMASLPLYQAMTFNPILAAIASTTNQQQSLQ